MYARVRPRSFGSESHRKRAFAFVVHIDAVVVACTQATEAHSRTTPHRVHMCRVRINYIYKMHSHFAASAAAQLCDIAPTLLPTIYDDTAAERCLQAKLY